MTREQKIDAWAAIVTAGFVAAVIFHYYQGVAFGRPYPFNTFLFRPGMYLDDYYQTIHASLIAYGPATTAEERLPYPPAMCAFASLFLRLGDPAGIFLFLAGFIAVFVWFCWPIMKAPTTAGTLRNVITFTGMCYPVLFAVDRANFEIYAFAAMAGFVYFFARDRYGIAAAFLGIAISFKLAPVVFVALFIANRRLVWGVVSVGWAALFTVLGLLLIPGSMWTNLVGWKHNVANFTSSFGNGWFSCISSLSIFHFIRSILALVNPHEFLITDRHIPALAAGYGYASVLLGILVVVYVVFFSKSLWKQVLLLTLCCNHLPQVSAAYKLLYVFLPMVLLAQTGKSSRYEGPIVFLLGLMLIPKSYFLIFHGVTHHGPLQWGRGEVTESVLINPLLGVVVGILVILSEVRKTSVIETHESAMNASQGQTLASGSA